MVKFILWLLFLIILAMAAVMLVRDDPGFLLLRYREFSMETTLAFGVVAVFVVVVVIFYLFRFLRGLLHLPGAIGRQSKSRRINKSRKQLNQGLIDLAEGRFAQAENNLIRLVAHSESPLLHYLAAARAAQLQGKHDERDNYLKAAHEARPEAEIAIGVTQAELQLSHRQTEQALATLSHLHGIAPRHDYVSMLLARAYCEIEDWKSLVELLPDVGRKKLLKPSRLKMMEQVGYSGYLSDVAKQGDRGALEKAWKSIPKTLQIDAVLVLRYVELMIAGGWQSNSVETLITKTLDKNWSDTLVDSYGRYQSKNANAQLATAEKWLEDMGQNECLLLALGRIAMRAKLWGKAQGYFEASISSRPTPAACLALAELFDHQLEQKGKAAELCTRGLKLSVDGVVAE